MKICLINNLYEPFNRGGAEKVTATVAQGLIKAGHEVFIITTKPYFEKFSIFNFQFSIYYLNSLYYNLNKFPKFFRFLWHVWDMYDIISYFKIKNILRREKCDTVITNNLMGLGFLTIFAIKRLNIKSVHIVHDAQLIHPSGVLYWGRENIINSFSARNYAGMMAWLIDSPRLVIFPSRWLMDMHLEKIFFIKSKRIVLPNPIKPAGAPLNGGRETKTFKFLYLGQIERHKGADLLIQAFKKVKSRYPSIELKIAGHGSDLERLKLLAKNCGRIDFLGSRSRREADQLLKTSHCLVLPSLCYENCPTAILDAFSAGLPVIAADLGGIKELLSKNAGLLFKPADIDDLAEKMIWLLNNRDNLAEMIAAGKAKAALCSPENYVKELEKLLKCAV